MNDPKVFGNGTLTIAIGPDTAAIYVGQTQIGFIEKLDVKLDMNKAIPDVQIKLGRVANKESLRAVEENERLIKTLPWVVVK
jgi:hypothetical protein